MTTQKPTAQQIQDAYEELSDRIKELAKELPGVTFGYVGNIGIDSRGQFDDTTWSILLPHPGRVGTWEDKVGSYSHDQLPQMLADWSKLEASARKMYAAKDRTATYTLKQYQGDSSWWIVNTSTGNLEFFQGFLDTPRAERWLRENRPGATYQMQYEPEANLFQAYCQHCDYTRYDSTQAGVMEQAARHHHGVTIRRVDPAMYPEVDLTSPDFKDQIYA